MLVYPAALLLTLIFDVTVVDLGSFSELTALPWLRLNWSKKLLWTFWAELALLLGFVDAGVFVADEWILMSPRDRNLSRRVGESCGTCMSWTSFSTMLWDTCSNNLSSGGGGGRFAAFFFAFFAFFPTSGGC